MIIHKDINIYNWHEINDMLPQITKIKSLDLSYMELTEFPKMSHITINDYFWCNNNKITSFKNCPRINGDFYCNNNQIASFEDCPVFNGNFYCHNNLITSFKDCPIVIGNFYCHNNLITSFKDCPIVIGDVICSNNQITSFMDCPEICGILYSDFDIFDKVQKYSKEKKISHLEAQVELYNQKDIDILNQKDKFPDLVAYIRLKELNKLLK